MAPDPGAKHGVAVCNYKARAPAQPHLSLMHMVFIEYNQRLILSNPGVVQEKRQPGHSDYMGSTAAIASQRSSAGCASPVIVMAPAGSGAPRCGDRLGAFLHDGLECGGRSLAR